MKKNFFTFLGVAMLLSPTLLLQAQDSPSPIYGEPNKYQRYLVLDNANYPEVKQWSIDIYHGGINPSDSSITKRLVESIVMDDKSFVKLSDFHLNKDIQTTIGVRGFDLNKNIIVEDEWISDASAAGELGWSPFCEATCNGSTYAYKVRVLEQIDNNTQVPTNQNGHLVDLTTAHFLWDEDLYVYIPLYQYMTSSEYSSMLANSFGSNQWYEWNTLAHHGLLIEDQYDTDGIKIVEYLNATPGQFRNSQNIKIMEPHVYAVQKSIGYFQFDIQSSHGGATLAPDQCGILVSNTGSDHQDQINEANNFTLYGNTKFTFPSSTQGLPYYNNELFCQNPWSYPGSTGGAVGTGGKWTYDKTGVPLFQYVAGGPSIGDDGVDLFDYMETMFTELRIDDDEDSFINSTGVAWWPGDAVSAVQLYRVDRTGDQLFTSPFTIYRDSLFDENNNLRLFEIETPKGLYNLVLHAEESEVQFPVILEVTQSMSHASSDTKCDRLDVSIFPVPIVDKKFTTQLSLDEKAKLKYTVIDDLGGVHFQRMVNLRENQVHKIPVTTPHLPNGLIFHTFEIENECVRTITTIKNE